MEQNSCIPERKIIPEWKIKKIITPRWYSVMQHKAIKIACGTIVTQLVSQCYNTVDRCTRYTTWGCGLMQLVRPTYLVWHGVKGIELLCKILTEKYVLLYDFFSCYRDEFRRCIEKPAYAEYYA